jgi:hypothetical protein
MVLVSLIIGLGIAELLSGVAQIIRNRSTIQLYWIHSVFVVIIFLALLQQWWEIWGIRDTPAWTFPGLLLMLAAPVGLFLIAHLVFPEPVVGSDQRSFYFEKMSPAFWIAVLTVLSSVSFRPVILEDEFFAPDNLSSFLLIAVFCSMIFIRNAVYHGVMVIFVLLALLVDILFVGMELQ